MKKQTVILIHCLYWLYRLGWTDIIGPLFSSELHFKPSKYLQPLYLSFLFISIVVFYINYLFVLPKYFKTKQYAKAWTGWVLLVILFISLRYILEEVIYFHLFGIRNYAKGTPFGYYFFDNIYWSLPTIIVSFFLWIVNDLIKTEKEKTKLQEEKRNAEVSFLRSQINPHFIFNTMNNIYSLVYHKSEKALPAIEKLSGIMRYIMKDNGGDKIELKKEIGYLKDYIELQSLRSAGDAQIIFTIKGDLEGKYIAPLLLAPFVENSFKHGVISDEENPFLINIIIEKNNLNFHCSNKIAEGNKDESSGIGLQNVKRRLELLYPGRYHLNIDNSDEKYKVTLNIDL